MTIRDLSRTAAAIERRDRLVPLVFVAMDRIIDRAPRYANDSDPILPETMTARAALERLVRLLDRIERSVGVAFGLDTARPHGPNDPETCAACVRVGEPGIALGCSDVSFVRRMVRQWREEQADEQARAQRPRAGRS